MIRVLQRRADFVAAANSGFKFVKPTLLVQLRPATSASDIRIGFTATKKLGNAVVRNRVKRRMRAAAARLVPQYGRTGCDYVFIGREAAIVCAFDDLIRDMKHALKRLSDLMPQAESQKSE